VKLIPDVSFCFSDSKKVEKSEEEKSAYLDIEYV